jgi:DMSO reductase anchor subunit
MHPAFSVIFFTTTSGAGYGLLVFLALLGIVNTESLANQEIAQVFAISGLIGLGLVALGLMSSSFHLANKKNAWRAFFRFKSSWLAREAVFAVLSFPITLVFIASFYFMSNALLTQILGGLTILLAIITVYSTGMIYGCLKTIRAWNTPLVPFNYIVLGLLTGILALMGVLNYNEIGSAVLEIALMIVLAIGLIAKLVYFAYIGEPSPLTVKNATNLPGKTVRLLDTGESASNANFLMREFGYQVGPMTIKTLRVLAIIMMFFVPGVVFFSTSLTATGLIVVVVIAYFGTMAERWLFFAEAKHVVNLFYGRNI